MLLRRIPCSKWWSMSSINSSSYFLLCAPSFADPLCPVYGRQVWPVPGLGSAGAARWSSPPSQAIKIRSSICNSNYSYFLRCILSILTNITCSVKKRSSLLFLAIEHLLLKHLLLVARTFLVFTLQNEIFKFSKGT